MKTPQEKAKELVDKYWKINTNNDYWTVSLSLGKKMAKIAVDEIIKSHTYGLSTELETYWNEVKEEINKL